MATNRFSKPLLTCLLALSMLGLSLQAAADNSQQTKMKTCNADATAKNLQGADRKAYLKTCLSAAPEAAAPTNSQQEKMKSCNAQAKSKALKGADRKQFMSTCLKGS